MNESPLHVNNHHVHVKKTVIALQDGKFWPARLNSTKLGDVYGVVMDRQRGNRPIILPRDDLLKEAVRDQNFQQWDFFSFFFYVRYSTLLHLPPLRFHCVGGCWDRTQDCCDFGIGSQTL